MPQADTADVSSFRLGEKKCPHRRRVFARKVLQLVREVLKAKIHVQRRGVAFDELPRLEPILVRLRLREADCHLFPSVGHSDQTREPAGAAAPASVRCMQAHAGREPHNSVSDLLATTCSLLKDPDCDYQRDAKHAKEYAHQV